MSVPEVLTKIAKYMGDKDAMPNGAADLLSKLGTETRDEKVIYGGLRQGLAASFGDHKDLTTLKAMDEKLKILIAVSLKKMEKIAEKDRNWETVQACFLNNESAEALGEAVTINPDPYEIKRSSNFKFDGSPDQAIIDQVMHWWVTKAVPDEDIRKDTKVNIDAMAKIVAQSGATVTNIWSVVQANEYHSEKCIDIGILRYPDMDNPYFKLYRIEVFAFSDCRRTFFHQEDTNGIRSSLTYRKFKPKESVIAQLKDETRKVAAKSIDDMFS